MTQNRSSAVMQQRIEPHDSLDDFPTPPWATRAILEQLADRGLADRSQLCREPCANRGFMVRPLEEFFLGVDACDVHDYGCGFRQEDYLFGGDMMEVEWTFMNPPFRLAHQFIEKAKRESTVGVAALVRSAFIEGVDRFNTLYAVDPPDFQFQHTERVPMVKGRYDPKASTATSYCWLVWLRHGDGDTRLRWIPPCRKRLERVGDDQIIARASSPDPHPKPE